MVKNAKGEKKRQPRARLQAPRGGPWLIAACLCERVLTETDGTHSLVRVIDRLTVKTEKPAVDFPGGFLQAHFFAYLKRGTAKAGHHSLTLAPISPSGKPLKPLDTKVEFTDQEDAGAVLIVPMRLRLSEVGLYRFGVWFNGALMTQAPLRVVFDHASSEMGDGHPVR
ncbi:DUF6941 family protein [Luteitalea sp.]